MPAEAKMTIDERRKYLLRMRLRYVPAGRAERSRLLDEMAQVTELHRESLVRLMKDAPVRKVRPRQRGRTYGPEVDDAIRVVAETLDYICAERLTPGLLPTARVLIAHGELAVSAQVLEQLGQISVRTVKRILQRIRQDEPRLPRRGPERAVQVLRQIPAQRIPWDTVEPGHCEVDLVHHCGPSATGDYLHTLQMIDVATGWSERVAVLGRSGLVMQAGFRRILARLPFALVELHPDNGSEFLNNHVWRFFKDSLPGLSLSRSRPWHKNDNRFVEQKNSVRCSVSQTPASCQSRKRRQQVMPEPQPISWGSISHGMPLLSTNEMPDSAARVSIRGRPPFGFAGAGGSKGPIAVHSSSVTSALAMPPAYHDSVTAFCKLGFVGRS